MNDINPKVTILIPTYNQQNYITKTIESALAQDYQNIEIIIADDHSTDQTKDVVEKLLLKSPKIKYFCNESNLGRVGNYRKALYEYATGNYVINVDGDDVLTDHSFIRKGIEFFKKFPDSNLLVGCKQYNYLDQTIKVFHKINSEIECINGIQFVLKLFTNYQFSHLTTIYNRDMAIQIDFYRENIISSDIESILRLALRGNVIVYNKIVGQWNLTGSNESTNQKFKEAIDNLKWINNVYPVLLKYTTRIQALVWKYRMKYIYSVPLLISIKNQKNISFRQISLMIKHKVLVVSLLKLTGLIIRKKPVNNKI